jgi:hypothetical protein
VPAWLSDRPSLVAWGARLWASTWRLGVGLALAVVLRWPVSIYLYGLPRDPNFPFHTLVARHLHEGGSLTWFSQMPFPGGKPLALVGVLPTVLATLLNLVTEPVVALNLALVVNIALQAALVMALCAAWGWRVRTQILAAVATTAAPMFVLMSGNSQHENIAFGAFALIGLAACRQGRARIILGTLGLLWAAFSSPYQAVPAGLFLLGFSVPRGRKALISALVVALLSAAPVSFYYGRVISDQAGARTSLPTAGFQVPVPLSSLLQPVCERDNKVALDGSMGARIRRIPDLPEQAFFSGHEDFTPLQESSYLGWVLVLLGVAGLICGRREPWIRPLLQVGLVCLVLALGCRLTVFAGQQPGIPLPWLAISQIPGFGQLLTTGRFLTGTEFALALGLARLVGELPGKRGLLAMGAASLLLAVDGLIVAPANWPVPAVRYHLPKVAALLPDAPIAVWPSIDLLQPATFETLALILDRPIAPYGQLAWDERGFSDKAHGITFRTDKEPAEWFSEVQEAGVDGWLRLVGPELGLHGGWPTGKPAFVEAREWCDQGWCVVSLRPEEGLEPAD